MHGRLKVKTTAEQEEQKRKEREIKLKAFRRASSIALDKIERGEYDDSGLEVTGQILNKNSDFSSMWNYRKRTFNAMREKSVEERQKMCKNELDFLASCLRNNPKSYGCWHHRCFILLTMPEPDWRKELELCNQFLQFDDRNFHCWDYRRFVVKNSIPEIPIADEIKCTNKLIESNFSNYSSWHYRSKLLPVVYPSLKSFEQIAELKFSEELEYVQNAFFTDPNDQSAWFYHQWLLGRGEMQQSLLAMHVCCSSMSLTCIFRKPISHKELEANVSVVVNEASQDGVWQPVISDNVKYQYAWLFKLSENVEKRMCIVVKCFEQDIRLDLADDCDEKSLLNFSSHEFFQSLSDEKRLLLKSELGSCIELDYLEPDNKWVVLTLVQLMYVLDAENYKNDIEKCISDLQKIDPMRKNYYLDLRSKILWEGMIAKNLSNQSAVNLSKYGLTRICHLQYFSTIKVLDLSSNSLRSLAGPFCVLLCCEKMIVDDNKISDISGIRSMPKLSRLSMKGNLLTPSVDLSTLISCPVLKTLVLAGNKLQIVEDEIKTMLAHVDIIF